MFQDYLSVSYDYDLSKDNDNYEKTLYFAKTDLNHLDVVVPAEPTETGNDSNDSDVVPLYWPW